MPCFAIKRAAASGVFATSASAHRPLALRTAIQVRQEHVGQEPGPPVAPPFPGAVLGLTQQLELIPSCGRWTVSAVLVGVLWHDFTAESRMTREDPKVPDQVEPRWRDRRAQSHQQVLG